MPRPVLKRTSYSHDVGSLNRICAAVRADSRQSVQDRKAVCNALLRAIDYLVRFDTAAMENEANGTEAGAEVGTEAGTESGAESGPEIEVDVTDDADSAESSDDVLGPCAICGEVSEHVIHTMQSVPSGRPTHAFTTLKGKETLASGASGATST